MIPSSAITSNGTVNRNLNTTRASCKEQNSVTKPSAKYRTRFTYVKLVECCQSNYDRWVSPFTLYVLDECWKFPEHIEETDSGNSRPRSACKQDIRITLQTP